MTKLHWIINATRLRVPCCPQTRYVLPMFMSLVIVLSTLVASDGHHVQTARATGRRSGCLSDEFVATEDGRRFLGRRPTVRMLRIDSPDPPLIRSRLAAARPALEGCVGKLFGETGIASIVLDVAVDREHVAIHRSSRTLPTATFYACVEDALRSLPEPSLRFDVRLWALVVEVWDLGPYLGRPSSRCGVIFGSPIPPHQVQRVRAAYHRFYRD